MWKVDTNIRFRFDLHYDVMPPKPLVKCTGRLYAVLITILLWIALYTHDAGIGFFQNRYNCQAMYK